MTPLELDALVRDIGRELQRRLAGAAPVSHFCGCGTASPPRTGASASIPQLGNGSASGTRAGNGSGSHPGSGGQGIAATINQALLPPDAGSDDIRELCREARRFCFGSVCVQPARVALAVRELRGSGVAVATVIGYPYGATLTPVKLAEAAEVLKLGAAQLELTIHPGALRSGDLDAVYTEIRLAVACAHAAGATLKVLTEMAALAEEQRATACALARLGGADGVKTSLDLPGAVAAAGDVALAHRIVGGELSIEAAGGVDSYPRFREMLAAGATRVATAAGAAIVTAAGAQG